MERGRREKRQRGRGTGREGGKEWEEKKSRKEVNTRREEKCI